MKSPEPYKDWIIEHIRNLMHQKHLKAESLSSTLGISQGELSKILRGERKDYYKYLPDFAKALEVTFHDLVTPHAGIIFNNNGSIDNSIVAQVQIMGQKEKSNKILLHEKDKVIEAKNKYISLIEEDLENMKRKYQNVKKKLSESEELMKKNQ